MTTDLNIPEPSNADLIWLGGLRHRLFSVIFLNDLTCKQQL